MRPFTGWWMMSVGTLACVLGSGTARADIPPPDGYVENCTIEKQQRPGMECVACQATHSTPCSVASYTRQCSTYGASVWTEIWCYTDGGPGLNTGGSPGTGGGANTGGSTGTAGQPTLPDGGCNCSVLGAGTRGLGWASLTGLALGLTIRRRRARKH